MILEELVPPLEMCKKIKTGKFKYSAFVWTVYEDDIFYVALREQGDENAIVKGTRIFPAPTLQEILAELPQHRQGIGTGNAFEKDGKGFYTTDLTDAEKAMRFWLFINAEYAK